MPKKNTWYILASGALSCVVFAYLLSVVRPSEIARAIRKAYVPGIAAYAALSLSSTVLRNRRYMILLGATEAKIPLGEGQMFLVTLVRNLFSDLLPARVGTLIYVVILKARFGVPVEFGTSVWAVAFVMDLVVMVPLMAIGVWVVGAGRLDVPPGTLWGVASLFFALTAAVLIYMPGLMSKAGGLVGAFSSRFQKARLMGEKLLLTGAQVDAIYRRGVFWRVVTLSVLVRLLKYGCIALLVYAILNPIDPRAYTLKKIGYWPVFVGAALAELSASTPLSGIGGFGAYEGVWAGAFYLLGYPRELAVLSGISAHIITQVFGYSLGAIAMLILAAPLIRAGRKGMGGQSI